MKNTNAGGTTNFIGLSFTINLTGLSSPNIEHITPATNIKTEIIDNVKNIFFFIVSFFKLNTYFSLQSFYFVYKLYIIFCYQLIFLYLQHR